MEWTPTRVALLVVAAFCAGAINSIAGGGSLLTFPALIAAGFDPLTANATSTVALVPGSISACWTYRQHLHGQSKPIVLMALPSFVGGLLGAVLLLRAGSTTFAKLVPWLLLGATGLFASQELLARWRASRSKDEELPTEEAALGAGSIAALVFVQFIVALYGGYFGAGIGIAMLAALSFVGMRDIHRMNALKNLAAAVINGIGVLLFLGANAADRPVAAVMAVAAIAGGRSGARLAQRVRPITVRRGVTLVGLVITAFLFAKSLLS